MNFSREDQGDVTVLRISGSLDALSTPDLRPTIDALVAGKRRTITIDLGDLRLIDSSGVGAIVSLYKRMRAQGANVEVIGLKDQPLAIFRLLRLDRIFTL